MSGNTTRELPPLDEGARAQCDQNTSIFFDRKAFSDVVVKFLDRKIYANRSVLCPKSSYFMKLCGPDSPFAEAKSKEIVLEGDVPDTVEAMLRHLYNYNLKPPSPSLDLFDKVRYYCQIVVAADKYDIRSLELEATEHVSYLIGEIKDAKALLTCLEILTDAFSDYRSLEQCAMTLARPRLNQLMELPGFLSWLAYRPELLRELLSDSDALKAMEMFCKHKCSQCGNVILGKVRPMCCGDSAKYQGCVYATTVKSRTQDMHM